jgi:hypothetical protein
VIRTGATGAGSTALAARGALTESSRADAGRVLIFLTWRGIREKPPAAECRRAHRPAASRPVGTAR